MGHKLKNLRKKELEAELKKRKRRRHLLNRRAEPHMGNVREFLQRNITRAGELERMVLRMMEKEEVRERLAEKGFNAADFPNREDGKYLFTRLAEGRIFLAGLWLAGVGLCGPVKHEIDVAVSDPADYAPGRLLCRILEDAAVQARDNAEEWKKLGEYGQALAMHEYIFLAKSPGMNAGRFLPALFSEVKQHPEFLDATVTKQGAVHMIAMFCGEPGKMRGELDRYYESCTENLSPKVFRARDTPGPAQANGQRG